MEMKKERKKEEKMREKQEISSINFVLSALILDNFLKVSNQTAGVDNNLNGILCSACHIIF